MDQLVLALLVAIATTPAFALVSKCILTCCSSERGPEAMQIQHHGCQLSDFKVMDTNDFDLELTPVLLGSTSTFNTSCYWSPEVRWMPGINITWRTSHTVSHHRVRISELSHETVDSKESTCFSFDVDHQAFSNMTSCSYVCERMTSSSVLVHIHSNAPDQSFSSTSILSLHENFNSTDSIYQGLSLFFRRPLVPENLTRREIPNPRHWATIITVRNDSYRQVSMTFELAPAEVKVHHYDVTLFSKTEPISQKVSVKVTNETTGTYAFYNVTPGTYQIRVETFSHGKQLASCLTKLRGRNGQRTPYLKMLNDDPCVRGTSTSYCLHVDTGWFIISAPPSQPHLELLFTMPTSPTSMPALSVVLILGGAMTLFPLLSIILAIAFMWRRYHPPHSLTTNPTELTLDHPNAMRNITKITVILVYSRDNPAHVTVVSKFAQLLRVIGHCEVLLDMEDSAIYNVAVTDWAVSKFREADKVIFINSEGALRRMEHQYTRLEEQTYGQVFPASVSYLEGPMFHDRQKCLIVTLPYSNPSKLPEDKLRLIFGNNRYEPTSKLNDLLLAIHDIPQTKAGQFRHWCVGPNEVDALDTAVYKELLGTVKEAELYHQKNPDWFHQIYGDPDPAEDGQQRFTGHALPKKQDQAEGVGKPWLMNFAIPTTSMERLHSPSSEEHLEDPYLDHPHHPGADSPLLLMRSDVSSVHEEQVALDEFCELEQLVTDVIFKQEQLCESGFRSWSESMPAECSLERTPPRDRYYSYGGEEVGSCTPSPDSGNEFSSPDSVTSSLIDTIDMEAQLHFSER